MWVVMYAVNVFYCHLVNKAAAFSQWLNRESKARLKQRYTSLREAMQETDAPELAGTPQPCGGAHINRNWLIYEIRVNQKYT